MNSPDQDLHLLLRSRHAILLLDTVEEERALELVEEAARRLELPCFTWSRTRGISRRGSDGAVYDTTTPDAALQHMAVADMDGIYVLTDFHGYLKDPVLLRRMRELAASFHSDRRAIVLVGTGIQLPPELGRESVHFPLALPGEEELRAALKEVLGTYLAEQQVQVALTREGMDQLVQHMRGLTLGEARRSMHHALLDDGRLDEADLEHILRRKQEAADHGGLLEFHPPQTALGEVGGMEGLDAWLARRRSALSQAAKDFGLDPPRGILVLGVQGCGKSMLARSVSGRWNLPLVRLDPSVLFDKYIGETEKNLRKALATVEALAPVVLWIDEIEKGFAANSSGDDGGTSQRLLGTFLTWIQERDAGIFAVATANSIEQLPPELLRKGRFDEIFFVDLPDAPAREVILRIHLERRDRDPARFDLGALAHACRDFSGAEIEQAIVSGLYTAFEQGGDLTDELLLQEFAATVPLAVTRAEDIAALRAWAEDRTVPAAA